MTPVTTIVPLVAVLAITALKDAIDDIVSFSFQLEIHVCLVSFPLGVLQRPKKKLQRQGISFLKSLSLSFLKLIYFKGQGQRDVKIKIRNLYYQ